MNNKFNKSIVKVLGFGVIAIGLISILGFVFNISSLYIHPGVIGMAFNTACAFVLIGLALCLLARE